MPLPDAVPDRRIYELLKTVDLENLTFSDFQSVAQTIYAEQGAEDELRRIVLVNLARLSVAGEWTGLTSAGGSSGASINLASETLGSGDVYQLTMGAVWGASDTANYQIANEQAKFGAFISPKSGTISSMEIYVSSAAPSSCNVLVGIYSDDAGVPDSLIASASFDVTSTGTKTQTSFTGTPTLTAGTQYWIAYVRDTSVNFSVTCQKKNHGPVYGIGSSVSAMKYTVEVDSGVSDNSLPATYPGYNSTTPQTQPRISVGVEF